MSNRKKPQNPLLVPPRQTTVYLHPGDVAATLEDLSRQMIQEQAALDNGGNLRVGDKVDHSKLERLAEQYDEVAEGAQERSIEVTLQELTHAKSREIIDANTTGDEEDIVGWQRDLVHASIVAPEFDDEQWDEFYNSCSEWNWTQLVTAAVKLRGEFNIPNRSAVSTLRSLNAIGSRRHDDTGSLSDDSTAGSPDDGSNT